METGKEIPGKYVFRVEISFQVDIVAEEAHEAEEIAEKAFLSGEYNVGPNGERVADIQTMVMEQFPATEDDIPY